MKLSSWCTAFFLLWIPLTYGAPTETLDEILEMEDISEFSMIISLPTLQPIFVPPSQMTPPPTSEVASITRMPTVPPTCFDPKCKPKPKPEPKPSPPKKHPPHKEHPPHKKYPPYKSFSAEKAQQQQLRARENNEGGDWVKFDLGNSHLPDKTVHMRYHVLSEIQCTILLYALYEFPFLLLLYAYWWYLD